MHIHQIVRSELESPIFGLKQPWLVAAYHHLLELPDHPLSRILVAKDGGRTCAILGLELMWAIDGRLRCATIRVLEMDPEHVDHGIVTRLIRFAEGIARVNRCDRIHVAPGLDRWGSGRRRDSLETIESRACRSRNVTPRFHQSCP